MDLLKAEIAKKKAQAEALRKQASAEVSDNGADSSTSATNPPQTSKFIRQKDRILWNQKQLEEEQRRLDEDREQRKRQKLDEEERNSKLKKETKEQEQKTFTETSTHNSEKDEDEDEAIILEELAKNAPKYAKLQNLSSQEVKNRLRQLRQPITLFGETHLDRVTRYIRCRILFEKKKTSSLQDHSTIDEDRIVTQGDDPDDELEDDFEQTNGTEQHGESDEENSDGEEKATEKKSSRSTASSSSSSLYDPTIHYHTMTDLSPEKIIYKFFRALIKQWEYDLREKATLEKLTAKGKNEIRTQKQCKDYIRPLFQLCKQKQVPYDIQQKLLLMVKYCELGNFVKANDEYIKTAIGNSAWPIGLTMVGIHERSGRERISTSKIAHVMNNEQERKYLTSVKRLMSYCQTKRPEVPPSMKVLS